MVSATSSGCAAEAAAFTNDGNTSDGNIGSRRRVLGQVESEEVFQWSGSGQYVPHAEHK
jgi:hypothetical protein